LRYVITHFIFWIIESLLSFCHSFNLKGYGIISSIETIYSFVNTILTLGTFRRYIIIDLSTSSLLLLNGFRCSFENLVHWLLKDVVQLRTSGHIVWVKRICWVLATQSSLLSNIPVVQGVSIVVLLCLKVSNFRLCSFDVMNLHNIPLFFLIKFWRLCSFNILILHIISYEFRLRNLWTKEPKRNTIIVRLSFSMCMAMLDREFWRFLVKFIEYVWLRSNNVLIV